jgi:hypothetical protein
MHWRDPAGRSRPGPSGLSREIPQRFVSGSKRTLMVSWYRRTTDYDGHLGQSWRSYPTRQTRAPLNDAVRCVSLGHVSLGPPQSTRGLGSTIRTRSAQPRPRLGRGRHAAVELTQRSRLLHEPLQRRPYLGSLAAAARSHLSAAAKCPFVSKRTPDQRPHGVACVCADEASRCPRYDVWLRLRFPSGVRGGPQDRHGHARARG